MSLNNSVACPLDCYDACQAYKDEKGNIKATNLNITNKKLCVKFVYLLKENYLNIAKYKNKDISLESALNILVEKLKSTKPENTIYYKGSGNLGCLQKAPSFFFSHYGSHSTQGSLCDGGGGAGIEAGRGSVTNPSLDKLINSDVIVVWGRNFSVTSPHIYDLVKNKTFITIDPIETPIAKKSELFLQLNPKTDHELALYFTRIAFMEKVEDEEFMANYCEGEDWFFDLCKNKPLVSYEKNTGVDLEDAYKFFEIIKDKTVSIVLGLGVQKYFEGAQITRCIDSFASYIGINNPNTNGGLWYLSDSSYGYENKFKTKKINKKIPIPEVDFSNYEISFIQGANPVVTAPNSEKVITGLKKSFVIYFGTTYNETCEYADLIIPSSSFLSKKDIRLPYGHTQKAISYIVEQKEVNTIGEYELMSYLLDKFSFENSLNEDEIFEYYKEHEVNYDTLKKFNFIEELDIEPLYKQKQEKDYYLITAKSKKSLNSQFKVNNNVYLNELTGYKEDEEVKIYSKYGSAKFIVKIDNSVKYNCALFYSGNKYMNFLTPAKADEDSNSAMYQEVLIRIESL